jgi:murein DD-endopeptidase MepM/ murein hydrolase activator NlpD
MLLIPSRTGVQYKIKRGDTLSSIAEKYDTDVEKIAEHNNIDGKKIFAGRSIFIPGAIEKREHLASHDQKNLTEKSRIIALKKSDRTASIEKNRTEIAAKINEDKNSKLHLSWPLRGPITSGFGYRKHPFSGEKTFHCGLDIGAEIGSTVRAAAEGKVIYSGWKGPYGNLIVVQHKNNYITVYAHNSKLLVEVDEQIKKGQKIALSGKTGATTGAHLHFEIRKGIVPLNPGRILK